MASKLAHSGDTDTLLEFATNDIKLKTGGATHFHATSDQQTFLYSGNAISLTLNTSQNATFAGDVTIGGNLIGTDNTTELGVYPDNAIKRIRMVQGGELHFGDTTNAAPLGITEGDWNNFGDSDSMSIYGRSSIKFYAGATNALLQLTLDTNATFVGNITFADGHFIGDDADDNLRIASSSGENIIIDSADDIILDAGGDSILLKVDGTTYGKFDNSSSNLNIFSSIQDKDIVFTGNDGGTAINALI